MSNAKKKQKLSSVPVGRMRCFLKKGSPDRVSRAVKYKLGDIYFNEKSAVQLVGILSNAFCRCLGCISVLLLFF